MIIKRNIKYSIGIFCLLVGLFSGLLVASSLALAGRYEEARILQAAADNFAQLENYDSAIESLALAMELRPMHPGILYTLATYQALAGDARAAIGTLNQFADMGLGAAPARNEAFASLVGMPGYEAVVARLETNLVTRIGEGELFLELATPEGLVEGIAYDPATETLYLSSVTGRKVIAIGPDGQARDFVTSRSFGLLGAMGMEVDAERRLLWVASAGQPVVYDLMDMELGRSTLLAIDLSSGALRSKVSSPEGGGGYIFGDLALGPDGAVYVTDSAQPAVYVVKPGRKVLELVARDEDFISLQGIVVFDHETLIVADYSMGLFTIDIESGMVSPIRGPEGNTILGLDGLELANGTLIAVQNGVAPQRVVQITLDDGRRRVIDFKVLESRNPHFNEPTLGVMVGGDFLLVANSQWPLFLDDQISPAEFENLLEPTKIVRIDLD